MKALIIEDEKAAVRNLQALLSDLPYQVEIVGVLDSIRETIEWFEANTEPDLVFLDIHLADGSAFEIFNHIEMHCPIIFTTAYDEYALKAFKVNSIDYLLKPIDKADIRQAFDKYIRLQKSEPANEPDYAPLLRALKSEVSYKSHFLIPVKGDKLLPVSVDSILYFFIQDGVVKARLNDDKEYFFPQTLDELSEILDPIHFFRVNRQYIIARKAVLDIDLWFNGRLSVNLKVPVKEKILVSKARVAEFKEWFTS